MFLISAHSFPSCVTPLTVLRTLHKIPEGLNGKSGGTKGGLHVGGLPLGGAGDGLCAPNEAHFLLFSFIFFHFTNFPLQWFLCVTLLFSIFWMI